MRAPAREGRGAKNGGTCCQCPLPTHRDPKSRKNVVTVHAAQKSEVAPGPVLLLTWGLGRGKVGAMSKQQSGDAPAAEPWDSLDAYSAEFVFHIALGLDRPSEVCKRYGVSEADFERIRSRKDFAAAVAAQTALIQREGISTKLKAMVMRDRMLTVLSALAEDPDISASTRKECALEVLALSGMQRGKPGKAGSEDGSAGAAGPGGFMLHIDLSEADKERRVAIGGFSQEAAAALAALNGEAIEVAAEGEEIQ